METRLIERIHCVTPRAGLSGLASRPIARALSHALGSIAARLPLALAAAAFAVGAQGCADMRSFAPEPRVYLLQVAEVDAILWRGSHGFEHANRTAAPQASWYAASRKQVSDAFDDAYTTRQPSSVRLGHRLDRATAQAVAAMQREETPRARSQLAATSMCQTLDAELLAVAYLATLTCRPFAVPDRAMVEVMFAY